MVGPDAPPPLAPPLPDELKQTTLPVMYPVTSAPWEEIPPLLVFVVTVAAISVLPHDCPTTVNIPDESTVIICGSLDDHVTWVVMSFVTGG